MTGLAREKAGRASGHCHKMIAEVAQAMAHECYDALMQRNDWYDLWKRQHPGLSGKALESRWVKEKGGTFVPGARATLAGMLQTGIDSMLKEQIMEALLLDNTLIRGKPQRALSGN